MSTNQPAGLVGLRHAAILVNQLSTTESFYVDLLGFEAERRPNSKGVYLSRGEDIITLHQSDQTFANKAQRVAHLGLVVENEDAVDQWYLFLVSRQIKMGTNPKTHRDGSYSFCCYDPDGNVIQILSPGD